MHSQHHGLVLPWCLAALTIVSALAEAQVDQCQSNCLAYNNILVGCQHDRDVTSAYQSCICNDSRFSAAISQCVACEGTNSPAYTQQQQCKTVAPDCTVACSQFSLAISGCGSSRDCVCSGAYDLTYTTTFNQAFRDCVTCNNGGGIASDWEAICCATGHGCNGMSPQASAALATIKLATTARPTATGGSQTTAVPTSTSSGFARAVKNVHASAMGWTQLFAGILLGLI
jgi:hypothetical protein